jgi:hypothetical protein
LPWLLGVPIPVPITGFLPFHRRSAPVVAGNPVVAGGVNSDTTTRGIAMNGIIYLVGLVVVVLAVLSLLGLR